MADSVIDLAATSVRSYGKNTYKPQAFEHIYTCNTGDLIPAFATTQINPGSSYNITTSILARLNTSRYPTIARGWIEYAWFYVPHMQVWDHWDNLMGENTESAWISSTTYSIPQISIPNGTTIQVGSLLDHFNWRIGIGDFTASALKVRAYNWIIDQYYRDQNIEAPYAPNTGDATITYTTTGDWTVGGTPYKINRKADLWSTCLPEPQKGPDVLLPLGTSAPVIGRENYVMGLSPIKETNKINTPAHLGSTTDAISSSSTIESNMYAVGGAVTPLATRFGYGLNKSASESGIYADLTAATAASIMDLREAVVAQHIYERDARSGTRAPEMLWARWGVEVDVLELGRPRLLTMGRFNIDFEQVPQTSASDATSPQGTLTAFGYTNNREENGTFSFKYAGTLMCLCAIRFEHKYQQGIPYEDLKKDRFDFWHPEFAGLGDDAVPVATIYATGGANGTIMKPEENTFGYAERGWEYKNFQSCITGKARSEYAQSMDYVHLADLYASQPTLSMGWMKENPDNLDRTIFVSSELADQWLVDFVAEFEITDTIPLYSIPGIDRL
nr:MAG: major capsid protein [Microviridae sp.]